MKSLVLAFCLTFAAHAGTVTVASDGQIGAVNYRVWKGIECLATVTTAQAVLTGDSPP